MELAILIQKNKYSFFIRHMTSLELRKKIIVLFENLRKKKTSEFPLSIGFSEVFSIIPTQSFRTVSVSNHSTHDSHSQLPSKYDP